MGFLPFIPSQVMLEEHHRNVTHNMPNPDWPAARRVQTPPRLAAVRRRVSDGLRAIADRLDPSGTRPYAVQLVVMPYPGTDQQILRRPGPIPRNPSSP